MHSAVWHVKQLYKRSIRAGGDVAEDGEGGSHDGLGGTLVSKGSADTKRKTRKYKVRNGRSSKGKGKGHTRKEGLGRVKPVV